MTAAKSIKLLERQHELIQKIIATMSLVTDRLDAGQEIDPAILRDIVAVLRDFPEKCPPRDAREISIPFDPGQRHNCIRLPRTLCEQFDSVESELGPSSHQQMKQLSTRWEHAL